MAKHKRDERQGGRASEDASRRIGKLLDEAQERMDAIGPRTPVDRRLALNAKASDLLSGVWPLPPTQYVAFRPGIGLVDVDPASTPGFDGAKADGERFIAVSADEIARYQTLLYANGSRGSKRRLLVVLQGMDASGKGGIVRHIFTQGNPMGIRYKGFGKPTEEELSHDFLWRVRRELPEPGWIGVFDRSHYEDIVMPHVYGTYPESVWRPRYDLVNEFESQLVADGCSIIKIFLVSSRDAQRRHFLGRLDDPSKHWKFDMSDLDARDRWDDYMAAWQEVFERTSTPAAPWYLVPADHRWYSRAVVSELLRDALERMNLSWPPLDVDPDEARRRLLG